MIQENKDRLLDLLKRHKELGISEQIDYNKFYLYSLITHSTAIEGSTVTEVEAQLLFDEGITSSKRTMVEQMMNLDLKVAYDYGMQWILRHQAITVDWLILLASKVMARTGSEYHTISGDFSAAKGELRKLKKRLDITDVAAIYELSFWAHYELVTIHPWADGNGRTSRLLMNLLQIENNVLPTKVLKEDKAEYIQSLIDTRENDDIEIFLNSMAHLHCQHLKTDIDQFKQSIGEKLVDKQALQKEMVGKWSIKPTLAEKLVDILQYMADKATITTEQIVNHFGFTPTTAKRYLRQLTQFGYLESQGGNKNRTYCVKVTGDS